MSEKIKKGVSAQKPGSALLTAWRGGASAQEAAELLKNGAKADAANRRGEPVLTLAAGAGALDWVKAILPFAKNLDARSPDGRTALLAAIEGGHAEIVSELLDAGAQPMVETQERGSMSAACAAVLHDKPTVLTALLARQEPLGLTEAGDTPLTLAAKRDDLVAAQALLPRSDVWERGERGMTALSHALSHGSASVAALLAPLGGLRSHEDGVITARAAFVRLSSVGGRWIKKNLENAQKWEQVMRLIGETLTPEQLAEASELAKKETNEFERHALIMGVVDDEVRAHERDMMSLLRRAQAGLERGALLGAVEADEKATDAPGDEGIAAPKRSGPRL
jgi:hypothetical protein